MNHEEARNQTNQQPPATVPWPPLLLALTILGAWQLGRIYPLDWPGLDDISGRVVGYAIGVSGIALMIWAIATLRRNNTTTMPHRAADQLVTDGPYALCRNPIYLADALILFGIAELTKNIWFVILTPVFVLAVTLLSILPEEKHLTARFGEAYKEYMAKTRRWI